VTREPLRVWTGAQPDLDLGDDRTRLALNPIVRAHLDVRGTADARRERYGRRLTDYRLTGPDEAEIAVLPTSYERTDRPAFLEFLRSSERRGLRTVVFSAADLEPIMPSASIVLLHPGPTRGAQPVARVVGQPYFFTDRARTPLGRRDADRPTVAFCGQAAARPGVAAAQAVARIGTAVRNRFQPTVVAPPIRGHLRLRAEALHRLSSDPGIDDHFVIRDRYRSGASTAEDRASTQAEFDDNLRSSTYALCVRGVGNFSARFYEALSFGRIPVVVDTGGVLPFEHVIDWRATCVWVDVEDLAGIGDVVRDAARAGDLAGTMAPAALRQLWSDRLTEEGFFHHLVDELRQR
jgi:glycosyltransferase involved in cell wall biosynthesis